MSKKLRRLLAIELAHPYEGGIITNKVLALKGDSKLVVKGSGTKDNTVAWLLALSTLHVLVPQRIL